MPSIYLMSFHFSYEILLIPCLVFILFCLFMFRLHMLKLRTFIFTILVFLLSGCASKLVTNLKTFQNDKTHSDHTYNATDKNMSGDFLKNIHIDGVSDNSFYIFCFIISLSLFFTFLSTLFKNSKLK